MPRIRWWTIPTWLEDRRARCKTTQSSSINFKTLSGTRPTKAFYPDDPSNVYHSYMRDHTKMRILHAGPGPAHVHHLHAHQWLKSPNSPEATYLDSQLILPGSAYTLEITYNGSGNRNQTVGDSIFHCHFYPHFAKGMWSLWRVHDTFEAGTELDNERRMRDGQAKPSAARRRNRRRNPHSRADPSCPRWGWPRCRRRCRSPIFFPGTTKVRAWDAVSMSFPRTGRRSLHQFDNDKDGTLSDEERETWYEAIDKAEADNEKTKSKYGDPQYRWVPYAHYDNPGYPFFIPGVGGHRPPHPPLDMAWKEKEEAPKKDVSIRASRPLDLSDNKVTVDRREDQRRTQVRSCAGSHQSRVKCSISTAACPAMWY